jgi:uncharacterized damage-inducible protein DinB
MVEALTPIWKQFCETHDSLRQVLSEVPDERLQWRPGPKANSVATIVQDIARANGVYAHVLEHGEFVQLWEMEESPSRDRLLERLAESERQVCETFERMTPDGLRRTRAERWWALGLPAEGPLDALWFAMEMVRHCAYHVGQISSYLLIWEGEADK